MPETTEHRITGYDEAKEALRNRQLRQALYDAGEVVMADVLVNLHGDEHRSRRRLENRLFTAATNRRYELELFPAVLDATLAPHVQLGSAELVSLSHHLMMNLAATTAGVDRPEGSSEETERLYRYMMRFIEGATLAHYRGDHEVRRAEVADALARFDEEFLAPSVQRRAEALATLARGELDEAELPSDVLTVLLRNVDDLALPHDVVLRETCFYLLAGAHTSATAFVRTLDAVFAMDRGASSSTQQALDAAAAREDVEFLRRCVHETVRLHPSSPVAMRWALADVELRSGRRIAAGDKVVVDLVAANRDPEIFGEHADRFDLRRTLPEGVAPWALSFGTGMHACIGQDLAAGTLHTHDDTGPELHGLVAVAVATVLRAGVAPDPDAPAQLDPSSERGYWSSYPVRFGVPA